MLVCNEVRIEDLHGRLHGVLIVLANKSHVGSFGGIASFSCIVGGCCYRFLVWAQTFRMPVLLAVPTVDKTTTRRVGLITLPFTLAVSLR